MFFETFKRSVKNDIKVSTKINTLMKEWMRRIENEN